VMADEELELGQDCELYEDSSTPEFASPTTSKNTIGTCSTTIHYFFLIF
jgi:hypothetical protein